MPAKAGISGDQFNPQPLRPGRNRGGDSPRPQIPLADGSAGHFQHLVEALLGGEAQALFNLYPWLKVT